MTVLTREHIVRSLEDVAEHGDNDVLPFDLDTRFVADCSDDLAEALHRLAVVTERKTDADCKKRFLSLSVFSERLLAPAGPSGFRVTTKIHPIWNVYLNALSLAVAEKNEPARPERAHSYHLASKGPALFDREWSWRRFKESSVADCVDVSGRGVVVQTDISAFYEHVYHHRLQNYVRDLLPIGSNIPTQIDVLLNKLATGRSFGLPVGGQGSRMLAEVLLASVDRTLSTEGLRWRRYVDDFVIVAESRGDAYRALGVLAHALADLGLSLNRNKTTMLSVLHYRDYVEAQLDGAEGDSRELRKIDLHFDPYSDTPQEDYDQLKMAVSRLDIERLLLAELDKGQPDSFVVTQASRAMQLLEPSQALAVCTTLLSADNMHAFRANWPSIMRGVTAVRSNSDFDDVSERIDALLDDVPSHSSHLLSVDTNCLHYLRTLRFRKTYTRSEFVLATYKGERTSTIRRACVDCWRHWQDRDRFVSLRNEWANMKPEEQRMVWLSAGSFGDDGEYFRKQERSTLEDRWKLGIERRSVPSFATTYAEWAIQYE